MKLQVREQHREQVLLQDRDLLSNLEEVEEEAEEVEVVEEVEEEVVVVEEGWRWRRCGELRPPLIEQPLAAPAKVDGHVGADAHRLEKRALGPRG